MQRSAHAGRAPCGLPASVTALSHLQASPWREACFGLSAPSPSRSHPVRLSGVLFLALCRIFWNQMCCNACCELLGPCDRDGMEETQRQKLQELLLVTSNPQSCYICVILCSVLASTIRPRARCPYKSVEWPRGTTQSNPLPREKPQRRRDNARALSRYCWLRVEFTLAQPRFATFVVSIFSLCQSHFSWVRND